MTLQGRYTVIRKVADGGMAEIYLATQHGAQGFEKAVVLKRIRTAYYADPKFRDMLIDEAHIAMGLGHDNIAQVLDLGEAGGRYFLALELVDGWSAEQLLRRARKAEMALPPELALYIVAEVCRGLAYAHARRQGDRSLGIVHRDVSTHNVLCSEQGEVKLTDFGIAKALGRREHTADNVVKGKIAFMSPEQASGLPLDARSDIFSLGVVLYEMAVGKRPFAAPTDLEALLLVKSCQFAPPMRPGLNPQVSRIIMRAMRKAPAERYQTADEMLTDIERVMRIGFAPAGQSALKQWLRDLAARDGALPISRTASVEDGEEISHSVIMAREAATVSIVGSDIVSSEPAGEGPAFPAEVVAPGDGPTSVTSGGTTTVSGPPVFAPGARPRGRFVPAAIGLGIVATIVVFVLMRAGRAPDAPVEIRPALRDAEQPRPATPAPVPAAPAPSVPASAPASPGTAAEATEEQAPDPSRTPSPRPTPRTDRPTESDARSGAPPTAERPPLARKKRLARPAPAPQPPPTPAKKGKKWYWPFD